MSTPTPSETLVFDGHAIKLFPTIHVALNKKDNPLDININNGDSRGVIYMKFGVPKEHRHIVKLPSDRIVVAHPLKHGTLHAIIDSKKAEEMNVKEVHLTVTGIDCQVAGTINIKFIKENEKEKGTRSDSPQSNKSIKKKKKDQKRK